MTTEALLVTIAVIALLLVLVLVRVPVAFSLLVASTGGLLALEGYQITAATLSRQSYHLVNRYAYIVIPMFVLMGMLAMRAGLAERTYDLMKRGPIGRLPGGLALATVFGAAGFGAVSGSSVATVATIGRISIGEMLRAGYNRSFAAGVVGASSTLGILIPPSVALVFVGILTGESIGGMLIAGIVPGIVSALAYVLLIVLRARFQPHLVSARRRRPLDPDLSRPDDATLEAVPVGPDAAASWEPAVQEEHIASDGPPAGDGIAPGIESAAVPTDDRGETPRPRRRSADGPTSGVGDATATSRPAAVTVAELATLFLVVMGGIYLGVFTSTEAAAIGAMAALIILILEQGGRGPVALWQQFRAALVETVSLCSMLFALLIGAGALSTFIVFSHTSESFLTWIVGLNLPGLIIVTLLLLALIPLGMFLDGFAMMVITIPISYPVVVALGYEGIWFGILVVKMIELSLITPPIGINLFVLSGVNKNISMGDSIRGVLWFYVADVITIAAIVIFPDIALWLPRAAGFI